MNEESSGADQVQEIEVCISALYLTVLSATITWTRGDGQLAQDLVQQACEAMTMRWSEARSWSREQQTAWLIRVARNKGIDELRHTEVELRARPKVWERYRPSSLDVFDEVVGQLAVETVWKVVDSLPQDLHRVAVLRWRYEYKHAEIAEELNLPLGTVKSRLHRAAALLRQALAPHLVIDGLDAPEGGK